MKYTKKKNSLFLNFLAGFLFLTLLQTSIACGRQLIYELIKINMLPAENKVQKIEMRFVDTSINQIEGKVVNSQTKEPIPAAIVLIKGTIIATSTDTAGKFKLGIPDSIITHKMVLIISRIGYARKEFPIKWKRRQSQREFLLTKWYKPH